jgi:hypothetical protein
LLRISTIQHVINPAGAYAPVDVSGNVTRGNVNEQGRFGTCALSPERQQINKEMGTMVLRATPPARVNRDIAEVL